MERKKLFLTLGAAGMVLLVIWFIIILFVIRSVRDKQEVVPVDAPQLTLCDVDASGPCVLSFGTDSLNRMVIIFELPDKDYPAFYAKVNHGETSERYECEAAETSAKSVHCSGPRTPLGDPIDIQIFASDADKLLAEGKFVVSAIILPTVANVTVVPEASETPATLQATPSTALPTGSPRPTPTPPVGYQNP